MQRLSGRIRKGEFETLLGEVEAGSACTWPVFRYQILAGLIFPEDSASARETTLNIPIWRPDSFLSFARLGAQGEPSEQRILGWVGRNGLLRAAAEGERYGQAPMKVSDFRVEVSVAYQLLTFYAQLRTADIEAIRGRIDNPESVLDEDLKSLFADDYFTRYRDTIRWKTAWDEDASWAEGLMEGLETVQVQDATTALRFMDKLIDAGRKTGRIYAIDEDTADLLFCWGLFAIFLTESVKGVRPGIGFAGAESVLSRGSVRVPQARSDLGLPPRLVPLWHCTDLIDALYLQFYLLVTERRPLRNCENPACGMPFPLARKDKRFCNSTCRSNARNYR